MARLLKEERHRLIVEACSRLRRVEVAELCRTLGVSEITIRRDLQELDGQGYLHRTHGGAIAAEPAVQQPSVIQRMQESQEIKEAIGRIAASLVHDEQSVFIGSGSTTAYVARNLAARRKLTVVTNALNVGVELATSEGVTVVVVGGMMRPSELSVIGHIAEQALREVRVDKVVIGITAISLEAGLSNDYLPEVVTDRAIIAMAHELILVADHTKFNRVASAYVAPVARVTTLVTDAQTDPVTLERIASLGVNVVLAE